MRRLVVLVVLLGVMFGLDALKIESTGKDPLTLAAIGFVLLAAFTVAELGSTLTLPRVTGYILSGVVLGPFVTNILSRDVVTEMRMFNTLALGLIAVGAGLELDVKQIIKIWRTLVSTIVIKVVLVGAMVGGTFYGLQTVFGSLELDGRAQILAVTLVFAALSVGTSPAIALAVMNENRAKGRLMDLVLGAAVLKDLVVVICLAVAVAVSRSLMGTSGGDESVLVLVSTELGFSILAGGILGGLLIGYIRFVRAEMLLFVAAMILVVSEVGKVLHLELLLVFITAGFVVRNFSKYEHELMAPVQLVALPVFVVFFTNAGAGIDLAATWRVFPIALALCAARAVGYIIASRLGGQLGGENDYVRKNAWLGYLPQAGVTLGLVGLAAMQLPGVGPSITALGMAVVALNLLVGPVTLRKALKGAGEIPESIDEHEEKPVTLAPPGADAEVALTAPPLPDAEARLEAMLEQMRTPSLDGLIRELYAQLDVAARGFSSERLLPWTRAFGQSTERIGVGSGERVTQIEKWASEPHTADVLERVEACRSLYRSLRQALRRCPEEAVVVLEDHNRKVAKGDGFRLRWRKRGRSLQRILSFGKRGGHRRVPVRLIVRRELELRMAALSVSLLGLWCRAQAGVVQELRALAVEGGDTGDALRAVERRLELLLERFDADAKVAILSGLEAVVTPLGLVDGPAMSRKKIRYSEVDPQVRDMLRTLDTAGEAWRDALDADQGSLRLSVELAMIEAELSRSLEQSVLSPAATAFETIEAVVDSVRHQLSSVRDALPADRELTAEEREPLLEQCSKSCDDEVTRSLERGAARLRAAASAHLVAVEARAVIEGLPESILLARTDTPVLFASDPAEVRTRRVALRQAANVLVIERLLPGIDEQIRDMTTTVAKTAGLIRESADIASHALESHGAEATAEDREAMREAFERALTRLDEHLTALDEGIARASAGIRLGAETALDDLARLADEGDVVTAESGGVFARLIHRGRQALGPTLISVKERVRSASALVQRIGGSQISQDVLRRVGDKEMAAADIWEHARRYRAGDTAPTDYVRLFKLEPVREHRLFTAYETELREIIQCERAWLGGGGSSALLVGPRGSGRTSMLNLCELELSAPRLLRPQPIEWRREIGLVDAVAIELGARPRRQAVVRALQEVKTTVLLDDLEQWFSPDVRGLRELENFLDLVISTKESTFWLASVAKDALGLLEESVNVREPFSNLVALEPLRPEALANAVEGRHVLSGRRVQYPATFASGMLRRLRKTDDRLLYFSVLARVSEGNLSRALPTWLKSVGFDDDGNVTPQIHKTFSLGLPYITRFPAAVLGILVQLLRFGPMSEEELTRTLCLGITETRRHLHFLVAAGLVEPMASNKHALGVPADLRPLVFQSLRAMGAVP